MSSDSIWLLPMLYASLLTVIAGLKLNCDKISQLLVAVQLQRYSVGPVHVNLSASETGKDIVLTLLVVAYRRPAGRWIPYIVPLVKLSCKVLGSQLNVGPPRRVTDNCNGSFTDQDKQPDVSYHFEKDLSKGEFTLSFITEVFDSNRYTIDFKVNGNKVRCPPFEIAVSRYERKPSEVSQLVGTITGVILLMGVGVVIVTILIHQVRSRHRTKQVRPEVIQEMEAVRKQDGIPLDVKPSDSAAQPTLKISSVDETFAFLKYRKRLESACKTARRLDYDTPNRLRSSSDVFASKYNPSSLQVTNRHWDLLRLAVTGKERSAPSFDGFALSTISYSRYGSRTQVHSEKGQPSASTCLPAKDKVKLLNAFSYIKDGRLSDRTITTKTRVHFPDTEKNKKQTSKTITNIQPGTLRPDITITHVPEETSQLQDEIVTESRLATRNRIRVRKSKKKIKQLPTIPHG